MRYHICIVLLVGLLSATSAFGQLYNHPESVVYDPVGDRYLVSNFGDGNIVQLDSDFNQSYFDTTLTRIAGLYLDGQMLYVASNQDPWKGLVGYDLSTDARTLFVPIAESNLLNDLAVDSTGKIFITDYWTTGVYRVDPATETYELFAVEGLQEPNGIIFDATNDRMIVTARIIGNPLHAIDVTDGTVSTIFNTYVRSQDGLARDTLGNLYISSWYTNSVYRFGPELIHPVEVASTGHNGPADIYFDTTNHILCVPNYLDHTVDFVPLPPTTPAGEIVMPKVNLKKNYPDPFNAMTTIAYSLEEAMPVKVEVFDIRGKRVDTLVDDVRGPGDHSLNWSPKDLASGVYFCRLRAGYHVLTGKLILAK